MLIPHPQTIRADDARESALVIRRESDHVLISVFCRVFTSTALIFEENTPLVWGGGGRVIGYAYRLGAGERGDQGRKRGACGHRAGLKQQRMRLREKMAILLADGYYLKRQDIPDAMYIDQTGEVETTRTSLQKNLPTYIYTYRQAKT
ncbi:hypothetical protein CIHG_05344 [Coccidioides immitis H538.4]|uniref:Uncharacterized protein n=1 Tax=Coccidioides immitis H538.4 TaxID=396776 RepID=A0A0J8UL01_COCIT|nr:hypothetical protein CIHG_05344 [Coccidioides immitis H538.4]